MTLPRRLLFRSLLIQALWNPRDLQGSALAWALDEPVDPAHPPEPFNAHPYLAGVALGALVREARDGRLQPEALLRFRAALRAPLGALGDALVWAGWVPFLALTAVALLLAGAPPVPVVGGFLVLHNVLHLALRRWGVALGLAHGVEVGRALGQSPLLRLGDAARQGAVAAAGVVVGLAVVRGVAELAGPGWRTGSGIGPGLGIEVEGLPLALLVVAGAMGIAAVGAGLAGRLPAATPHRVALLLVGAGWLAALLGGG
jgi:hypothetical protein